MLVTDPDVIIADYCIKSYEKIKGIKFKLIVYSNYISQKNKKVFFPKWSNYHYVKIIENNTLGEKPKLNMLEEETHEIMEKYLSGTNKMGFKCWKWAAPFDRHDLTLDRELRKFKTPYVACVDADFEILDEQFIIYSINKMNNTPNLKVMSADYSSTAKYATEVFPKGYFILNERYNTWFCIYKRDVLNFPESHRYRDTYDEKTKEFNVWDTSAYYQKRLRMERGYKMESCPDYLKSCFIHYAAFAKNRSINTKNLNFYRFIRLLAVNGLLCTLFNYYNYDRTKNRFFHKLDYKIGYFISGRLFDTFFRDVDNERKKTIFDKQREKLLRNVYIPNFDKKYNGQKNPK